MYLSSPTHRLAVLAIVTFSLPFAAAAPTSRALAACAALTSASISTETWPLGLTETDYETAQSHYWSAANADLIPACVVFPNTTQDVSTIVKTLLKYPDVPFAVKSGGHNPNVGYSSVDGGVLITMINMASTILSSDHATADVGPGSRWGAVIDTLTPHNLTVVGGRIADVGVGGLLLGGGLSFLSTQYGLPCDNIVNYEVVLADASIVNANARSHTDLYWALKGGGNQYGIVTKFTLKTHPMGQIWGGIRIYLSSQASALINATADLTSNYKDPKAAVIVTGEVSLSNSLDMFLVFYFYDGPTPPAGVFDKFDAIPHLSDSTQTQSYSSLLSGNDATNVYGFRYLIRGTTLPNLPKSKGTDLYNYHYTTWKSYIESKAANTTGFIFSMAFQPLPAIIHSHSAAAGGNALAIDPAAGDKMWMEYDTSWLTSSGDATAHSMAINVTNGIDAYAKAKFAGVAPTAYKSGDLATAGYTPIFLNDAMYDQKPLQSYGRGSYERLSAIQKDVDPTGFFPGRTGGFKLT